MARKPKPFLHQGHYYTTAGGEGWRKLCTEAEGFDKACELLGVKSPTKLTPTRPVVSSPAQQPPTTATFPLVDAVAAYLKHCLGYYKTPAGKVTSEVRSIELALSYLTRAATTAEQTTTASLTKETLKDARELMIPTCSRKTCNQHRGRITRAARWWVDEGWAPLAVAEAFLSVLPLPPFRSAAKEHAKITEVGWESVEKTLPKLAEPWKSIALFQWHSGLRPGEACGLTLDQVTLAEEVGRIDFGLNHKTGWRGTEKTISIGKNAMQVLLPWVQAAMATKRDFIFATSWAGTGPDLRPALPESYAHAVKRACKRAKVEHWHPNQIRHTFGTRVRAVGGLEAAQLALGHSRADVTQIYAEKNAKLAEEVARKLG